ncbi:MAG TPA: hypothetical protein VFK41_07640 [Nocardioidaceae bacterium]|nr:hypothetical protein [Nocardioidaceae bacterium]
MPRTALRQLPPWALPWLVFVIACLVYIPTSGGFARNTDTAANSLAAWKIATTGQPWMDGVDERHWNDINFDYLVVGRDGHEVVGRTPGQILAGVPFYVFSSEDQAEFSYRPGDAAAAVMTAGALALLFAGLRRQLGDVGAAVTVGVFGLATPVWTVAAHSLWTHSVTVLAICAAIWSLTRSSWLGTGVALGVGMLARPHLAFIAATIGLGLAWKRRSPKIAVLVGVPCVASLGALAALNRYVYGRWSIQGSYAQSPADVVPGSNEYGGNGALAYFENMAGFLVSLDRGLFLWSPFLVLLIFAVLREWKGLPDWSRWLAVSGLVYAVVQVALNEFHGSSAFYGYRLALELLVCGAPALAFSASALGRRARRATLGLLAVQFGAFATAALYPIKLDVLVTKQEAWDNNVLARMFDRYPGPTALLFVTSTLIALGVGLQVLRRLESRESVASDYSRAAVVD